MNLKERITTAELAKTKAGKQVTLAGWVQDVRNLGKLAFIILRDRDGQAQLVVKNKELQSISRESVIAVKGKVQDSQSKKFSKEVKVEDFEIFSRAEPLPIEVFGEVETDLSKRLDHRTLDLRRPEVLAIFKVRTELHKAIRDYFNKLKFIEVVTPKISGAGMEGGAEVFALPYFNRKAFLNQSQQIYKQFMQLSGFERTYEMGPSFRAENSNTIRHMTEFTHLDVEMSFINSEEDVLKVDEELLVHCIKHVKEHCKEELKLLGADLEIPKLPIPRVPHREAIRMLQKAGTKIKDSEDIGSAEEKILGHLVKQKYKSDAFFLTEFPWELKVCKFYSMHNGKYGRVADLEYKGTEISTNAQREHRYDVLIKQLKEKGLKPKDFEFYTEPFKYGVPPHGGFGVGVERLLKLILNIENIREVTLFPRDTERLTP